MTLRRLLALVVAGLVTTASAEAWAVQTVALRDYREAQAAAAELRLLSFDAYTEFAMQNGLQFVRVRVGCFTDRAAADAMSAALAAAVVREAAVVEFTVGAPVRGCATTTVGFMKPSSWEPVNETGTVPAFAVRVAGNEARVLHDGERWRVLQGAAPIPPVNTPANAEFREVVRGGVRFVAQLVGSDEVVVCPGRLLGQAGRVAIVDQEERVVACGFDEVKP